MSRDSSPKGGGPAVVWAILAAAFYALNAPLSKLLLEEVSPSMMAALLYLGAGAGMLPLGLIRKRIRGKTAEKRLSRKDLPYIGGMVALDIAAPIFLMLGLQHSTPESASLLNNFEIVATSLIALWLFGEAISKRLWLAIGLITLSGIILSFDGAGSLRFSAGSALVILACVCWGFENNCTRALSGSDPLEIVVIKGVGSGTGALIVAKIAGEKLPGAACTAAALGLGFVAYGLSIFFYVYAQRTLGAARTSAYYAVSPFIGAALSLILFHTVPSLSFLAALVIMIVGTYLASTE